MHAKVTVADDTVFVGSFNLSHSGELNAENVLELDGRRSSPTGWRRSSTRCAGAIPRSPFRTALRADQDAVRRLALVAALAVALLAGSSAHALRLPAARHCPVFPANNAWNQRVDTLPVAAELRPADRLDRARRAGSRRLRLRQVGRRPDRDPVRRRLARDAAPSRLVRVRRRVRPRPLPDPAARPDRGRRARDGRSARDPRRQEHVPALRAVRPAPREAAVGRPGRARRGASARTTSGRRAGRRPTPPGCRSSPASPAGTRSRAA